MVSVDVLGEYALIIVALLFLEAVLSFDNAAVLAAMVRKLPIRQRRKALTYGLVGAYALRFGAVVGVSFLIQNPWLRYLGGGYLVFLAGKHFWQMARGDGDPETPDVQGWNIWAKMGIPVFWATIIQIELIDLAFAIDQVVAAVGYIDPSIPHRHAIILIVVASFTGILFLRLAAVYMARLMDWLPMLEHMAYVAVGFVGIKLIVEQATHVHFPKAFTFTFTLGLFLGPILLKLIFKVPRSGGKHHPAELGDRES